MKARVTMKAMVCGIRAILATVHFDSGATTVRRSSDMSLTFGSRTSHPRSNYLFRLQSTYLSLHTKMMSRSVGGIIFAVSDELFRVGFDKSFMCLDMYTPRCGWNLEPSRLSIPG